MEREEMNIKELIINGFICFKDKHIKFDNNTLIFGSNGSGKSALIDAICFGLYGKTTREWQIINKEFEKANVTLYFNVSNHTYKITRTISKDGTISAELLKDNQTFTDGIEKEINSIFGSFNDFITKSLIKQDYLRILDYDTHEALKITFNLNRYDEYKHEIEKRIAKSYERLKELMEENNSINSRLKEIRDPKTIEIEIKQAEKRLDEYAKLIENAKKRLVVLEKDEEKYINTKNLIESINSKINILNEQLKLKEDKLKELEIKEYDSIKKEYNEFIKLRKSLMALEAKKTKYDILNNNISLLTTLIEEKKNLHIQLSEQMKNMKDSLDIKRLREEMISVERNKIELENERYKIYAEIQLEKENIERMLKQINIIRENKSCTLCNQSLNNTKELISTINKEISITKEDIQNKENKLSDIINNLRQTDTKILQLEKMIIKSEIDDEKIMEKNIHNIKEEINKLNAKLSTYKSSLASLKFNNNMYEKIKERYEQLINSNILERYVISTAKINEWKSINEEIKRIKNTISSLNKTLDSLLKKQIDYNALKAEIANKRNEITKLEYEYNTYNLLIEKKKEELKEAKSVNVEELKNRLNEINSSIADINEDIKLLNELNDILRDSLLAVINKTIDSIKPYLNKFMQTLNLNISYQNNTLLINGMDSNNLSRGEKALAYLILRLCFMLALNTSLIIIDENLSIIDKEKVEKLISMLHIPLMVATHQDLRYLFKSVVELP